MITTLLSLTLFGCHESKTTARQMDAKAACYTLEEEVPHECLAMADAALGQNSFSTAVFGYSITCSSGIREACNRALDLRKRGASRLDASLVVSKGCFEQDEPVACRAYLDLVAGEMDSSIGTVAHAERVVQGSTPDPEAAR